MQMYVSVCSLDVVPEYPSRQMTVKHHPQPSGCRMRQSTGSFFVIETPEAIDYLRIHGPRGIPAPPSRHRTPVGVGSALPQCRSYCRKRGVHQKQGLLVSPLAEGPDRIAALSGALLTGRYAAARHNLPLIDAPAAIDLAVPHTHGRPPTAARSSGVVVHRERFPLFADPDCPWLASVRTTVNHLVRHESRLGVVAALDHVRHKNLMPLDGIVIPSGGPFLPKVREALRRSRTGVRSPLETVVRLQLEDAGIEVETAVLIDSVG